MASAFFVLDKIVLKYDEKSDIMMFNKRQKMGVTNMLVFIDESGYPNPNDNNLFSVLLAVCINEDDVNGLTRKIYKLKKAIYDSDEEIKSTNLIKEQTITKNRSKNKEYAEKLIDKATKSNIHTFCVVMPRPERKITVEKGMLAKQYQILVKKIAYFAEKENRGKVIFIFDEVNEGEDTEIAKGFDHFLFTSKIGKRLKNILCTPFFVSSAITPTIQIADIFAGVVRKHYELELNKSDVNDNFKCWVNELYAKIFKTTCNFKQISGDYYEYGFQEVKNLNYIKRQKQLE